MQTVELKTAYFWHCDNCGAANFALPAKPEMVDEDREQVYRHFNNLDEYVELPDGWEQFEIITIPKVVTCWTCYAEFATIDERLVEPDQDDLPDFGPPDAGSFSH